MINLKNIQTEVDAGFLYGVLADNEEDKNVASLFRQMSEIEHGHALVFLQKNNMDASLLPSPSRRARVLKTIGKLFGYDYVLGVLLDTEKSISSSIVGARQKTNLLNQFQILHTSLFSKTYLAQTQKFQALI